MSDLKAFKKLMMAVETDNNPNAKHREIASGMHAGTSAIGMSGLMPVTAQEMVKNKPKKDVLDKVILKSNPELVTTILKDNPEKYQELVDKLSNKMLDNSDGDPVDAAIRWRWGQNKSDASVEKLREDKTAYVKRVNDKIAEQALSTQMPEFMDSIPKEKADPVLFSKLREKLRLP